jgi:hypothetical protein
VHRFQHGCQQHQQAGAFTTHQLDAWHAVRQPRQDSVLLVCAACFRIT